MGTGRRGAACRQYAHWRRIRVEPWLNQGSFRILHIQVLRDLEIS